MIAVLYDIIYIFPVSLATVLAAGTYLYAPKSPVISLFLIAVVFAICICIVHWKSRLRFLTPFILLLSALTAIFVHKGDDRISFIYENRWMLWSCLTVAGSFVAGRIILIHRWGKRVLAALIPAALAVCMWEDISVDKAVIALAFLPVLLVLTEEVQYKWKKSGYTDLKSHLVGVSPFPILICFLVFLAPASKEPYDWQMFIKIWEKASEGIELTSRLFHSGDEDYHAKTGFDTGDSIFGDISEDHKAVIKMTSDNSVGNAVYLVGGVCDTFDGRTWSATHTPDSREHMLDILETVSEVSQTDPDNIGNYIRKTETEICYLDFNTSHVFMPEKSLFSGNAIDDISLIPEKGCFKSVKPLGYSSSYSVSFYRMNMGNEECIDMLKHPVIPDEKVWNEVRLNRVPECGYMRGDREIYDTSYGSYLEYQDEIYKIYLPETEVSDKTEEYLDGILEGADSDYEKLLRIEDMLAEMDYDLNPGKIPGDVVTPSDYLDHLLFNTQKGFCTHYATAFILLARSRGIPARLVQGFYVSGINGKETVVTASMAHSWPEAYIRGAGWIAFEPTPGKKTVDSWSINAASGSTAYVGAVRDQSYKPEIDEEGEDETEEGKALFTPEHFEVIIVPVLTFILLIILFVLFENRLERQWYGKLNETDKFKITGRRNLKILEYLGYVRGEGETLSELAERAGKTVDPEILRFIAAYERMLYGEKDPISDQIRSAELVNWDLLEHLKEEKGKLYFIYRMRIMHPEKIKK
ncbi:MAG: transglutaminase domain-containing protein [Lachnospiraceae bacterium]|nr:transglutaminase domain-containing protein [Lachnospiraceae bacterium]